MSQTQVMLRVTSLRQDPTALIVHYSRVGREMQAIAHCLVEKRLLPQVGVLLGLLNKAATSSSIIVARGFRTSLNVNLLARDRSGCCGQNSGTVFSLRLILKFV